MHRRNGAEQDFATTLARLRAGDESAFDHVYASLAPAVTGLFRMQGAAEPEDLTSEVFVGVLRNLGRFDGDERAFRSWVFTIAYRRLADERRRQVRRPAPAPLDGRADAPGPVDVAAEVERALATERVCSLCERLVPSQRDVLLLRLVGQLTIEEVARAMGRSMNAVKALQRRGLASIGRLIQQERATL
ncbi:MAG TPA: RNA polymerase sigma factor [Acidimicrobiales bacterium]